MASVDEVILRLSGEMKDTLANLEPIIPFDVLSADNQLHDDDCLGVMMEQFSTNLPELVTRMKQMVTLMETNTKMYDSLKVTSSSMSNQTDSTSDDEDDDSAGGGVDSRQSLWLNDTDRPSTFTAKDSSAFHFRESVNRSSSWRANVFDTTTASFHPRSTSTTVSSHDDLPGKERQSFRFSESFKKPATVPRSRQGKPMASRIRLDIVPPAGIPVPSEQPRQTSHHYRHDYSVKWTHGDLGISLNNFTKDRRGFQISSLEQSAQCFTTGIGNARLGDVLVFINHHDVELLPCDQVKDILLTAPRPMELFFRSNPKIVTSPTSAEQFRDNQRVFEEGDVAPHLKLPEAPMHCTTDVTESVYNDELEDWLRRQDEMHSALVLLLTETLLQCESLKADNFDELQRMMERAIVQRRRASSAAVVYRGLVNPPLGLDHST
ncbi:hypothetical protein DYB30_008435 [Aphanomyces astaci]|uniref:PDZ domain-containing protein n=1 Tax=Aphanomyces astaci TaxID=112090 RepID=A0A397D8N0_APHAT|nr:hypothetical protein DYB30_008435 [Aphanomyces astaci]